MYNKEYYHNWYLKNREKRIQQIKQYNKQYYKNRKEYYKQLSKQYYENHKEYLKQKSKIYHLEHKYNLSFDILNNLYQQQEGKCAICHKDISLGLNGEKRTAYVDHNHNNGKVRGLLCNNCNILIGNLEIAKQSNPLVFQNLKNYLEREIT